MILYEYKCKDCSTYVEIYKDTGKDIVFPTCECGCTEWLRVWHVPKIFKEIIPYHGQGKRFKTVAESQDLINKLKKTTNQQEAAKMQTELAKISEKKS